MIINSNLAQTTSGGEIPTLNAPSIVINDVTLTITPSTANIVGTNYTFVTPTGNYTYKVYADGSLITTTTDSNVNLSSFITAEGTYAITVKASKTNYNDSVASNSETYLVSPVTNYVRFVSASARTITPIYTSSGVTLQYSVDSGATWTNISSGSATTSATEHWFRGQATGTKSLFTSSTGTNAWVFSGSSVLEVYGNLNFLLCDALGDVEAPTSLGNYCYDNMFFGCTSLTTAPSLPATTLTDGCYQYMFQGCTALTTAPSLPATTLAYYCYQYMFSDCTSLTTAPELPATTLADYCYYFMFSGCASLTTVPELPATTLKINCYTRMFSYCTSLTTAPELPATTLADECYVAMFFKCTSLTTAPELPATTLADECYVAMFKGCTSFKVSATNTGLYIYPWRIPTSGTGTEAARWNESMLTETGGTFTSNPTINTTYYVQNQPV